MRTVKKESERMRKRKIRRIFAMYGQLLVMASAGLIGLENGHIGRRTLKITLKRCLETAVIKNEDTRVKCPPVPKGFSLIHFPAE